MSNEVQVFTFDSRNVRTLVINDEPWFVGRDVAKILGYSNPRDVLSRHVDEEDKGVVKLDTLGGKQNQTVINESGLYSLIIASKLPSAKKFKHWVTSEVLPSIRKHGAYVINAKVKQDSYMIEDPIERAKRWIEEQTQLKETQKQLEIAKPKALFADSVAGSKTSILIGVLAKIIKQNGVAQLTINGEQKNMGQNNFFKWLRDNGYLISRRGDSWNTPTQQAVNLGLFEIKESTKQNPDGSIKITKTTTVTGKGQQYFVNKFLGKDTIVLPTVEHK